MSCRITLCPRNVTVFLADSESYIFGGYLLSAVNRGTQLVQTALVVILHADWTKLPAAQVVQEAHAEARLAPLLGLYVPASQGVHAVCPERAP
jgi:hypothetical protein